MRIQHFYPLFIILFFMQLQVKSLATQISHHLSLPSAKAQTQANIFQDSNLKNNDQYVEHMIKSNVQQSFADNKSSRKHKSRSLAILNQDKNFRVRKPEQFLSERLKLTKLQAQNHIKNLEKQCTKFGGAQYIRDQMNKQKINNDTLRNFYVERIKSIHGCLSLPKITLRGSKSQRASLTWNKNPVKADQKRELNKKYNKWYIQPKMRFTDPNLNAQQPDMNNLTKYVNKFFTDHNKHITIKQQYAPIVIRETELRLGRKPVICTYAQISRR